MGCQHRVGGPGGWPIVHVALTRCLRFGCRQKRWSGRLAEIRWDRIPFRVKNRVLVTNKVSTLGIRRRIYAVRGIRVDESAVRIEIYCGDVLRLVKVADEVGKHEERP